jgi:hypothetical protein
LHREQCINEKLRRIEGRGFLLAFSFSILRVQRSAPRQRFDANASYYDKHMI